MFKEWEQDACVDVNGIGLVQDTYKRTMVVTVERERLAGEGRSILCLGGSSLFSAVAFA